MTNRLQKRLRCVIAYAVAYAIALQGFFFALDIGNAAFAAKSSAGWAGFELCAEGGAAPKQPAPPVQGPMGRVNCMFCLSGAIFLNSAPPAPPIYHKVLLVRAVATPVAPRLVALASVGSAWPRGPPA